MSQVAVTVYTGWSKKVSPDWSVGGLFLAHLV